MVMVRVVPSRGSAITSVHMLSAVILSVDSTFRHFFETAATEKRL